MKIIFRDFYARNTLEVAQNLLGCFLVREYRGKIIRATITETEAYVGEDDLASHASRGRTPRTETMYGDPGRTYVYMIYGMYYCLNIVTEKKDFPAAVLIRGVEIRRHPMSTIGTSDVILNGPGKLCKFLKIDKRLNGWDMTQGEKLWIESRDPKIKLPKIIKSKRIGVDYAKHCKEYLWRFSL
jgi:DNA-3-methyladenine glycosylase